MQRDPKNGPKFFVGTEVEHTPAFGKRTLFVVGVQTTDSITQNLRDCEHIYFGANMSFPNLDFTDSDNWIVWESMIKYFLKQNYLCTLDVDIACAQGLIESGLTEYHNFIPMISAKIPYIGLLGYNATLKIDDCGFRASNPGVWCHSLHELQDRHVFTDWTKYSKDTEL